jgi:AcrR family transcriptional regulator
MSDRPSGRRAPAARTGPLVRLPGWPSARQRASRAREPLSVVDIVAAAVRVIDAEGLDALSMRRLGGELGSGATSLYWHVRNKDELLDLVIDWMVGLIELPSPGRPWRARFETFGRSIRTAAQAHPRIVPLFGVRAGLGPNALTLLDWMIGVLDEAGFDPVAAAMAYGVFINYALGYIILEQTQLSGTFGPEVRQGKTQSELEREVVVLMEGLPVDRFPNIVSHAAAILGSDDDARYAYGMDRLLDGFEADLARRGRGKARPGRG